MRFAAPSSVKHSVLAALLIFLTFSVYAPLLRSDFINYDDQGYVYNNPQVTSGLTLAGLRWAFTSTVQNNWHPLTWLSHMLDVNLFGLWAGGHHLTSLLFHLLNTLLVLWTFRRLTGRFWPSFLVAALFAFHPMHVESVAWIAERKDVLSTFLFLLTLRAYHSYTENGQSWRMTVVVGLHALGLMAKPMLVTLPFVLLLFDYWPLSRFGRPTTGRVDGGLRGGLLHWVPPAPLWIEKIPLFALSGLFSLITVMVQSDSVVGLQVIPFGARLMNLMSGYGLYLLKALLPLHLSVFYPLTLHTPVWPSLLGGTIILTVTALVLPKRRARCLLVGWFFFLGTLVPVIGLVQVGNQAIADRYTYIPYLGLFIMAAYGGAAIHERSSSSLRLMLLSLAGIVLIAFCFLTARQVPRWRNSRTLFSYVLSHMPNNAEALFHLADDALERKSFPEAISLYLEGLKHNPADPKALNNLGSAYLFSNDLPSALKCYDGALRVDPHYTLASRNRAYVLHLLSTKAP